MSPASLFVSPPRDSSCARPVVESPSREVARLAAREERQKEQRRLVWRHRASRFQRKLSRALVDWRRWAARQKELRAIEAEAARITSRGAARRVLRSWAEQAFHDRLSRYDELLEGVIRAAEAGTRMADDLERRGSGLGDSQSPHSQAQEPAPESKTPREEVFPARAESVDSSVLQHEKGARLQLGNSLSSRRRGENGEGPVESEWSFDAAPPFGLSDSDSVA